MTAVGGENAGVEIGGLKPFGSGGIGDLTWCFGVIHGVSSHRQVRRGSGLAGVVMSCCEIILLIVE